MACLSTVYIRDFASSKLSVPSTQHNAYALCVSLLLDLLLDRQTDKQRQNRLTLETNAKD